MIRRKKKHLYKIGEIPVYRREDSRTGDIVKVAYFDDWTRAEIGSEWSAQLNIMLETMRTSYEEIMNYWKGLRNDFYSWCRENGLKGWGVHFYDDRGY